MTTFALDTNVISELVRDVPNAAVVAFLRDCPDAILSAPVVHELAYGVERLRSPVKRMKLELFVEGIKAVFEGRIVSVDVDLAELAGRSRGQASRAGWVLGQMDSLIAATAIGKNATLVTRNIVDFERLEMRLLDPWAS